MKVSIELMKQFGTGPQWQAPVDDLVAKIGSQLGAVEDVADFRDKYKGIKIVEITAVKQHPDADKLNVYEAYDGREHVQVVSGDTSLDVGDKVAWIEPGMTVPSTVDSPKPFKLEVKLLRGQMSHGMFASGKELGISDDHAGVLKLDTTEPAGSLLADVYGLSDVVIDIENKMFTHRPDCFGNLGVAREIAGIHGQQFKSPNWYTPKPVLPKGSGAKLTVKNEIPELVPRYMAVALDVKVAPSPLWLQTTLFKLGIRPINNVVDITNYVMAVTAQPLHAFDYDKVAGNTIVVRKPRKGESLQLLDGKTITPHKDAMLICDSEKPIGLGGMMGGANSEIGQNTQRIILECATFDMFNIRRLSMHHGIFTDAVTRFSKGQSPRQCAAVLVWAVSMLQDLAGAKVVSNTTDLYQTPQTSKALSVEVDFINSRLGSDFDAKHIAKNLENVEFKVDVDDKKLHIEVPFWRTDIEIPEDVVEEIGRLNGYDVLPHKLPKRTVSSPKSDHMADLKSTIRGRLSAAGANELQTYSFVPAKLIESVGQAKEHSYGIRNAISPELEHYRLSITPSLLDKVHSNIKAGFDSFVLFEMGKVHIKGDDDCDGLPREYEILAVSFASKRETLGAPYYYARHYLDYLAASLNLDVEVVPADRNPQWEIGRQVFAPFEPKRSGFVLIGGEFAGFIGEYNARTRRNLKLPAAAAGFELDLDRLLKFQKPNSYQPLLRFPAIEQDICFKVDATLAYGELVKLVREGFASDSRLRVQILPLDIYQSDADAKHKQITLRANIQHPDRTLTTDETNKLVDSVVSHVASKVRAERV